MILDTFWISVALIVAFGTIGGVLYKFGTDRIKEEIQGAITLDRLVQVEISRETIPYLFLLFFSVGLFFFSGYSLRSRIFAAQYLFAPVIFLALIMLSLSRFFVGAPLSQTGLGRLTALLTAIGVVATVVASWVVFRENFNLRTILGVGMGVVAIYLIGEEA